MKTEIRTEFVARDKILKMLSDNELAKVCTAETARQLADGTEYLDLEKLDLGVLRTPATLTPMGRVLTRPSVLPATWNKIVAELGKSYAVTLPSL